MPLSVSLHPLALLNLSDHYTRETQRHHGKPLIGVLLGSHGEEKVDIVNSFELVIEKTGLDTQYLNERLSQQRTILPQEEVVGLYEINNGLRLDFISSLNSEFNGSVLINLVFSPELASKRYSNEKFYRVYEVTTGDEVVDIEVATKRSEKIAVDTVLEIKETNYNDLNKVQDQVNDQKFILSNLKEKIEIVTGLLENEKNIAITPNYCQFLRDVNSFVHKLQYKQSEDTKLALVKLENQYNLLLNLGQMSDNIVDLNTINTDIKKVENLREI